MIAFLTTLFILFRFVVSEVSAQVSSTEVAQQIQLTSTVPAGSLICFLNNEIAPCVFDYDPGMYGVTSDAPAGDFRNTQASETDAFIARNGISLIRVNNSGGDIKVGDYLTSSTTAGIAKRASHNGFVIGQSMEDFSGDTEGLIQVALNIHQTTAFSDVRSNLLELIRQGISAPVLTPLAFLRYVLSAFVLVAAFVLGFIYFGRVARVSIEALGRNPLAAKTIQLSIFVNVLLMFGVFCIGLILAYLILAI